MRSITAHKSELTTAIAQIFGRNLQHATDDQLSKLTSDCLMNSKMLDSQSGHFMGSTIYLTREKEGVSLSAEVTPRSRLDALRTLAILANIAADREAEKLTVQKLESELHQTIHGNAE